MGSRAAATRVVAVIGRRRAGIACCPMGQACGPVRFCVAARSTGKTMAESMLTQVADKLRGTPTPGWASLMVVTLILGGGNMIMLGILGEYLWRALDEGRRRPRYVIETTIGQQRPKKQNND